MPTDNMPAQTDIEIAAHETLVDRLRNTHALEKQQIQVLNAHLELFAEHCELHARVTEHVVETREQARRLEAALEACGDSASMVKDAMMSAMGLGQSTVQGYGDDAVLKAVMADTMQEHLEIATYRTLITLADMAGKPEIKPGLEETLREEKAMSDWLEENLEGITQQVVSIKAQEKQTEANASARAGSAASVGETSTTQSQQPETSGHSAAKPASTSETSCPSKTTASAGEDRARATSPEDRN